MIHVTKDTFQREVLDAKGTVLVDFWASWCGPCKMIAPVLEEIEAEKPDVKIAKVNVDEEMDLAMQYQITGIPALLVFRDGNLQNRSVGVRPKSEILQLL